MTFLRFIIVIAVVAIAYFFVSPQIPAVVTVKDLTPIHGYGSGLALDVTVTNYTLQSKELYLTSSNLEAATSLYVDYATTPPIQIASKETAVSILVIPPLGNKTIKLNPTLSSSSSEEPVAIAGNSKVLPLSDGRHKYVVSIGGYTSGEQSLAIQ